jgi:hypothetical protein
MAEKGYGGPKVAIFDCQGTLLNESTDAKAFGDLSLKRIIDSLRIVQKETNEFLTKLVHEQTSQNMSKSVTVAVEEGKQRDENNFLPDNMSCRRPLNFLRLVILLQRSFSLLVGLQRVS